MADYDLIVRNAKIVTAERQSEGDIAVKDGKVAALGADVKGTATREIDAAAKFVLPGGVDSHCHIAQLSSNGLMTADDFESGTRSAACGGTTTVIPFAAQHRGMSLRQVVKDYHASAEGKAFFAAQGLGKGRPDRRVLNWPQRLLPRADDVCAAAMIAFLGAQTAHHGEAIGHGAELRQVLTKAKARNLRFDFFELAAVGMAGLHVEGVGLRRPAGHPKQDTMPPPLLLGCQLIRQERKPAAAAGA